MNANEKVNYLARHYYSKMLSEATLILNDHHLAEDACQDTFIKLLKFADLLQDVESESARNYCLVILRNSAKDLAKKWFKQIPDETVYEDERSPRTYDRYPFETADMINDIMGLPERYRDVVTMRCIADKSCMETAFLTGSTVGTVNSRLNRAKKILRKKWNIVA